MVDFTYYGHACFLLDDGKYKLLFDPFLTGNPLATIKAADVKCDYILITHAHGDHIGDAPFIAQQNNAEVISTPEVLELVKAGAGNATVHGMNLGGSLKLPFGSVKMVTAHHSAGATGGIPCGFVVHFGGEVIYFAGDTSVFGDMRLIGELEKPQWAILPIGDNYTMGPKEATKAIELLDVRHVIPVHYNTWPIIEQDAKAFKRMAEAGTRAKIHVINPGATLELSVVENSV